MTLSDRRFFSVFVLLAFGAILAVYYPFLSDDALISLRYADRFADGLGLTWNNGYRVEGYSNFAWVAALAGLHVLGLDLIVATRLLGLACALVVLFVFLRDGTRRAETRIIGPVLLAFAVLAHPLPIWVSGGLEGPMIFASLFLGAYLLMRWWEQGGTSAAMLWGAGASLAVLTLTRPDAALLAALCGLFPMFAPGTLPQRLGRLGMLAALPACAFVGQMIFRVTYYGAWVPNTARIKLAFSETRLWDGMGYVADGLLTLLPLILVLLWVAFRSARQLPAPFWIAGGIACAWSVYVALIGGDIFPGFRHLLPVLAMLWIMALQAQGAPSLAALDRRFANASAMLVTVLAAGSFAALQFLAPSNAAAIEERWEWTCKDLAEGLARDYGAHDPLLAVTAAGCWPYWTGFETVDLLGLNDLELPNRAPDDLGTGFIGHEIGDLDYLIERQPDIVIFTLGTHPLFAYAQQMRRDARFHDKYCEHEVPVTSGKTLLRYLSRDFHAKAHPGLACLRPQWDAEAFYQAIERGGDE